MPKRVVSVGSIYAIVPGRPSILNIYLYDWQKNIKKLFGKRNKRAKQDLTYNRWGPLVRGGPFAM